MDADRMFVEARLVCADCGHELEPGEIEEQQDDPVYTATGELRCLNCGEYAVKEIEVDLRDVLLRAAQNTAEAARLAVERKPEVRERVEGVLADARSHVEALTAP